MAKKKTKNEAKLKNLLGVESFRNEWEELQLNILYTAKWIEQKLRKIHADMQVTPHQIQVMRIIHQSKPEPISIEGIKAKMIENDADMSRMILRLVEMKLVKKEIKRSDRRHSEITLTDLGEDLLAAAEEKMTSADQMFYNLSKKEAKSLNKLLNKTRL